MKKVSVAVETVPSTQQQYREISARSGEALRTLLFDRKTERGDLARSVPFDQFIVTEIDGEGEAAFAEPIGDIEAVGLNENIGRFIRFSLSGVPLEIVVSSKDAETGATTYTVKKVRDIVADGNVGYVAREGITFSVTSKSGDDSVHQLTFAPDALTGEVVTMNVRGYSAANVARARSALYPSATPKNMFNSYAIEIPTPFVGFVANGPQGSINMTIAAQAAGDEIFSAEERTLTAYIVAAHTVAAFRCIRVLLSIAVAYEIKQNGVEDAYMEIFDQYAMYKNPKRAVYVNFGILQGLFDLRRFRHPTLVDAAETYIARVELHDVVPSYECFRWKQILLDAIGLGTPTATYNERFAYDEYTRNGFVRQALTDWRLCAKYAIQLRQHPLVSDDEAIRETLIDTYNAARVKMLSLYQQETMQVINVFLTGALQNRDDMKPYVRLMKLYTSPLERAVIAFNTPEVLNPARGDDPMVGPNDPVNRLVSQWKIGTAAPPISSYVSFDGQKIDPLAEPPLEFGLYPELIVSKSTPADAKVAAQPFYEALSRAAAESANAMRTTEAVGKWADAARSAPDLAYANRLIANIRSVLTSQTADQLERFIRYTVRTMLRDAVLDTFSRTEMQAMYNNPGAFFGVDYPVNIPPLPDALQVAEFRERLFGLLLPIAKQKFAENEIRLLTDATDERLNVIFRGSHAKVALDAIAIRQRFALLLQAHGELRTLVDELLVAGQRPGVTMEDFVTGVAKEKLARAFQILGDASQYLRNFSSPVDLSLNASDFAQIDLLFTSLSRALGFEVGVQPWFKPAFTTYTPPDVAAPARRAGGGGSGSGGGGGGGGDARRFDDDGGGDDGDFSSPSDDARLRLSMQRLRVQELREKRAALIEEARVSAQRRQDETDARAQEAASKLRLAEVEERIRQAQLQIRQAEEAAALAEHQRKIEAANLDTARREEIANADHRRRMAELGQQQRAAEQARATQEEKAAYERQIEALKFERDARASELARLRAESSDAKAVRDAELERTRHQYELDVLAEKRAQTELQHRIALAKERTDRSRAEADENAAAVKAAGELELRELDAAIARSKVELAQQELEARAATAAAKAREERARAAAADAALRLREQEERSSEAAAERKRVADELAASREADAMTNRILLQQEQSRSDRLKLDLARIEAEEGAARAQLQLNLTRERKLVADAEEKLRATKAAADVELAQLKRDADLQKEGARLRFERAEIERQQQVNDLNATVQTLRREERLTQLRGAVQQIYLHFAFSNTIASERGIYSGGPDAQRNRVSEQQTFVRRIVGYNQIANRYGLISNVPPLDPDGFAEFTAEQCRVSIVQSIEAASRVLTNIRNYIAVVVENGFVVEPRYDGPLEFAEIDTALRAILETAAAVGVGGGVEKALMNADPAMTKAVRLHARDRAIAESGKSRPVF